MEANGIDEEPVIRTIAMPSDGIVKLTS